MAKSIVIVDAEEERGEGGMAALESRLNLSTSNIMAAAFSSAEAGSGQTAAPDTASLAAFDANGIAFEAVKSGPLSRFDTALASLYYQASPLAAQMSSFTSGVGGLDDALRDNGGATFVTIDATAKDGDGAALLMALQGLGLEHGSSFGTIASGVIDAARLDSLLDVANLAFASMSGALSHAGLVTTQADLAEHADTARSTYAVDGAGVKVGVISDSFNRTAPGGDTMAVNIANGDLPVDTTILQDDTVHAGLTDEGRGMAQLVHDLAPGSSIQFATGELGKAGFANNIVALAAAGAKVIVDDLIYFNELAYQDDIVAQAVDMVEAQGVSYFSAAGNQGTRGYEGAWNPGAARTIGTTSGGSFTEQFMQFAQGQDYLALNLQFVDRIVLQWDQPANSASGPSPGATGDLDLFITNAAGDKVYQKAFASNIGNDPVEVVSIDNLIGDQMVGTNYLRVGLFSGDAPSEIRIVAFHNGFDPVASSTSDATIYGHATADGATGVGAAYYQKTPAFSVTPPVIEAYSAGGPVNILFDVNGNRLATPDVRKAPQITAADGGNTTFFGSDDSDADAFPNFFGTSAAAPDAAAVAALMLQARSGLTPADVRYLLMDSALDMDNPSTPGSDPGFDNRTGAGLIQADKAVGFASTLTIANAQQAVLWGTHFGDTIIGSAGSGNLNGLDGADALNGAAGSDVLKGGEAGDRFVLDAVAVSDAQMATPLVDSVADYDHGTQPDYVHAEGDTVDLSSVLAGAYNGGAGQNATNLVRLFVAPGDGFATLQVDLDGAANGPNWLILAHLDGLVLGNQVDVVLDPSAPSGVALTVTNQAPLLEAALTPVLTAENEDPGRPVGAVGTVVSSLVDLNPPNGGLDNVTDVDGVVTGIALTGADTSHGNWFYSINGGTDWLAVGTVGDTSARLLAADANTRVFFLPNSDFNGTISDAITFRAWDQTSGTNGAGGVDVATNGGTTAVSSAIDTANITINAVDDFPTAVNDTATVAEDGTLNGASVLANDLDVDTPTLTAELMVGPGTGAFTLNSDGTYSYTPPPNYNGLVQFFYRAHDASSASNIASVTITVTSVPDMYTWSTLAPDTNIGFFDAQGDVLQFDAGIPAAAVSVTSGSTVLSYNGKTVTLNSPLGSITTTNITFADGSKLLVGDNKPGTALDEDPNTLVGGTGRDQLLGLGGNDFMNGGAGSDRIDGGLGNDTVIGGPGNDMLIGGACANYLIGGADADTLDGRGGTASTLQGGTGDDVYIVDNYADSIVEFADEGVDEVRTTLFRYDLRANLENLTYTGSDEFYGNGNGRDNLISGGAVHDLLLGGDGNDTLVGKGGANYLVGGVGNDTLDSRGGTGTVQGGTGDDVYLVDSAAVTIVEFPDEGTDAVHTTLASYTLRPNLENLTFTGSGNFYGKGNALDNVVTGGAGNDLLGGFDGNDTLVGNGGTDYLVGLAGNDTLDARNGFGQLQGGIGDDVYLVDNYLDSIVEFAGEGTDEVRTALALFTLRENLENLTYTGSAKFTGRGNDLANVITGGGGADLLDGLAGSDTLLGLGGDDVLVFDAIDAHVDGGQGSDMLRFPGAGQALDLDAAVAGTTLSSIEIVDLTGSGGNTLTLSAAAVIAVSSTGMLQVDGNGGDTVVMTDNLLWTQGADVTIGANNYHTYTQGAAVLRIDTDVTNNFVTF